MSKGFTLIEVMIVIAIFVMLIFSVSAMLNDIFVKSSQQVSSLNSIDRARLALSVFTNEIRDAVPGNNGSYPINQAGGSQIIFYSNYKTGGAISKRIRYYISDGALYRGVVVPVGSPARYILSSEIITLVASDVSGVPESRFYYYDGDYDGSTDPLAQPVNLNDVRFVKLNLMIFNKLSPNSTSVFPISAGVAIRSVKNNLGN